MVIGDKERNRRKFLNLMRGRIERIEELNDVNEEMKKRRKDRGRRIGRKWRKMEIKMEWKFIRNWFMNF